MTELPCMANIICNASSGELTQTPSSTYDSTLEFKKKNLEIFDGSVKHGTQVMITKTVDPAQQVYQKCETNDNYFEKSKKQRRLGCCSHLKNSASDIHKIRIKQALVSFCRWTSVRGMPHMVRSDNRILRRLWGVFVLAMFSANISLVVLLLKQYYRFETIENIKTVRNDKSLEFPALTVCNVDPVNSDRIACFKGDRRNDSYCRWATQHMHDAVNQSLGHINNMTFKDYISSMEDPSKSSQLFQMLGMKMTHLVGHQLDDFIIKGLCTVTYHSGGNLKVNSCDQVNVTISTIVDYKYFNCYTLTIGNESVSQTARGMSLVLYLDQESELSCDNYCTHQFAEWSGSKAVIHPARTFPQIDRHGMNLLAGASNQLLIAETRLSIQKNIDTGNSDTLCEMDENKKIKIFYILSDKNDISILNYTDELCFKVELQKKVIKNCQCLDALLPLPFEKQDEILSKNMTFCGDFLSKKASLIAEDLLCKENIKKINDQKLMSQCLVPCKEFDYFVELTQLRWPQKPEIIRNYINKIKDRTYYKRKFLEYERIFNMTKNASQVHLAMEKLNKLTLFEDNFLQIDVNKPNFDLIKYSEKEEFSLTTLLSQVGGICSIFLGFTFVTVLELIELCYRIYQAFNTCEDEDEHEKAETKMTKDSKPANACICTIAETESVDAAALAEPCCLAGTGETCVYHTGLRRVRSFRSSQSGSQSQIVPEKLTRHNGSMTARRLVKAVPALCHTTNFANSTPIHDNNAVKLLTPQHSTNALFMTPSETSNVT